MRGAVAGHGHGAGEGGGFEPRRCLQPRRQAAGYGAGKGGERDGGWGGAGSGRRALSPELGGGRLVRGGEVK